MLLGGGFWGCQKTSAPVAPGRPTDLTVSLPVPPAQRAFLLGAASNEILYNLAAPGSTPVTGKVGPFSTSGVSGTIDFTLAPSIVPPNSVLAIQLNDAANGSPMAVGASALGFSGSGGNVSVEMGSVVRACYYVSNIPPGGGSYSFDTNTVNGPVTDISVTVSGPGFLFQSPLGLAFMGNGDLVNFASLPSTFTASSTTLSAGDVYCVVLSTGGHAWVQVVSGGTPGTAGPTFRFRANKTLPYYTYDPTTCDYLGRTPTPTDTPTITNTPTVTATYTVTSTPSDTGTPTLTGTPTNTSVFTPTLTPSDSPTLTVTATVTATYTATSTPSNTGTPTPTGTPTNTGVFTPTSTPSDSPTLTVTATVTSSPTLSPSPTTTSTPTVSPTPGGFFDITTYIDNGSVSGSTAGQPDLHSVVLGTDTWGAGAPDLAYQFTLTSPKQLFFNLCNASFDSILYLCTDPTHPSSTLIALADDSQICGNGSLQTTLTTPLLQSGITYYLVVDGFQPGDAGPFTMAVSTFTPTSVLTGLPAPVTEVEPNDDDTYFTQVTSLGVLSPGGQLDGVGNVRYYADEVDTWGVTVTSGGTLVTLSLDDFDDGTGKDRVALDLYDANNNLIDSSAGNTPLDQVSDVLAAGTYHIAVYSITDGSDGAYRLAVQAVASAVTPTYTPTITPTPSAGGQDITSYIDSGLTITGDTNTSTDAHTAVFTVPGEGASTYGLGAPDVIYQFTLSQPKQLYLNLCGSTFDTVVYILTNPSDPNSVVDLDDDSDFCGSVQSTLVTAPLAAGTTYYVVVDGYSEGDAGPFAMTLSTFNPVCALAPTSTPNPAVTPGADATAYTDAGNLGTVGIGTDLVGAGDVKSYLHPNDTWKFTVSTEGFYLVTADCYNTTLDNREQVAFDIFAPTDFSTSIGASPDVAYPNQTGLWLTPGDYYVDVFTGTNGSDGAYHLVIQGVAAGTPQVTPTPTDTPTSTITQTPADTFSPTPTPTSVAVNSDITSFIDSGKAITGDTSTSVDSHSVTDLNNNILGTGSPDVAYTFTVSQPQQYYFTLTPTGNFYYPIIYLLGPNTTTTLTDLRTYFCNYAYTQTLTTGVLQPGTYTVVLDEYYSNDSAGAGPFSLTVSTFHPVCALNPTSTPNPVVTPGVDDTAFTDAGDLGTVSPGSDLVGAGQVRYELGGVNTWHFHVSSAGEYSVSADCYDDGTGKDQVALDLYESNGAGGVSLFDATTDTTYPNGMADWLLPGDYYVAAYSNTCGADGSYHLVIQGTLAPTPTPEVAVDITSYLTSGSVISGDTTGHPDAHSYNDIEGNSWGHGAPDVVYQFSLNQPQQLDIQLANQNINSNQRMVAYLRTKQDDPSTTLALAATSNEDDVRPHGSITYLAGGTNLITPLLKPGTYYLIVDGSSSGDYGAFFLSLSNFTPQCGYIGTSAPVTASMPNLPGYSNPIAAQADDLGTVSSGITAVGVGAVEYYVGAQHVWHFTAGSDGVLYNISLDCFDDGQGLDAVGFDLYDSNFNYIDSTGDISYPNGTSDSLPAGDYYVAVFSNQVGSDGQYRLVVQGGIIPTPTATPTSTPTPLYHVLSTWTTFNGSDTFSHPDGIAVDNPGGGSVSVYVSDEYNSRVVKLDSAGNYVSQFSTGASSYPLGIAVNSAGTSVYVANQDFYETSAFYSTNGVAYSGSWNDSMAGQPWAVAVDGAGNVYATDGQQYNGSYYYNNVLKYTSVGGSVATFAGCCTGSGLFSGSPSGVGVNSAGTTVYAVSVYNQANIYTTTDGVNFSFLATFPVAEDGSDGLAVDGAGNVYISETYGGRVLKYDYQGNYVGWFGGAGDGVGNAGGIAVDNAGNPYLVDQGANRVLKYAPNP